jgi:hypothetical protein
MARANTWANLDGLGVGFGTHTDDNRIPATEGGRSGLRIMTLTVTGTEVEAAASLTAASLFPQSARIPYGSQILRARFQTVVPFTSGGAATLNIGTYKWDAIGTVDDADGIDAAVALTAIDAIGEIVICDGALVGGVVPAGATSNSDVAVVVGYGTAAYTAGVGILTVEYVLPTYGYTIAA